ncbi:hypothetical protein CASFOL_028771 [Castilleja foliolosa]|uniref:Uncharacterized protein n=1 Tax=Castilleja foliolosa TaxID=1961234 RepID=A0ABD3CCX2_9LAMI
MSTVLDLILDDVFDSVLAFHLRLVSYQFVHKLNVPELALSYCDRVYESGLQQSAKALRLLPKETKLKEPTS